MPVPFAFNDWPAPVAVPTDRVRSPVLVRSTTLPLALVTTSERFASVTAAAVPSVPTRDTVTATSPTVSPSLSSTNRPPAPVAAVSVVTVVSM